MFYRNNAIFGINGRIIFQSPILVPGSAFLRVSYLSLKFVVIQLLRSHKETKIWTPIPSCLRWFDLITPPLYERSKLYVNPPPSTTTITQYQNRVNL